MTRFVRQIARCTIRTFGCPRNSYALDVASAGRSLFSARPITTTRCVKAERWYTDKHEWVQVEGKIGVVGISDYAQNALGDVVYAQFPDVGSTIKKQEECGALESVKAASELTSPVSGRVVAKNEAVENKPGLINSSCYGDGWLFKIELTDPEEIKGLMDEKAYTEFLKTDPH